MDHFRPFKVVNLSRFYRVNFIRPYWVNFTVFSTWGPVEWWENGVKMGEMEPCEEFDPDYVDLYATVTNKTTRKYCQPAKSFHMFRIKPSPGVKAGEVRVTDRFGTTYTEHVSW